MSSNRLSELLDQSCAPELAQLLKALAGGCSEISGYVREAGLAGILGSTGDTNVQGETVQKLDDLSNEILMKWLSACGSCAGYLSEENEGLVSFHAAGKYVISVDPLDGSSNIDIAAPIGTIFSVMERLSESGAIEDRDFLQTGRKTVAAGYCLYGSTVMMMLSTGKGLHGFTLHPSSGEYLLTHPDIRIPAKGKIYSCNQGNAGKFTPQLQEFISWCTETDKAGGRPYSLRYIGSMVGDMHRTFLKGGIFFYPANRGEAKGKLRLLYECIPMAFLAEQAGGAATDGQQAILDLHPTELHERTAIYIGSQETVEQCTAFLQIQANE
jgi:fructose-1,6-bisphosphatase I